MTSDRFEPELQKVSGRDPETLAKDAIIAIAVGRNEAEQIPWFLDYYRRLGVEHFLYVDNASEDDSKNLLLFEPDVTLFHTDQGYLDAANGRHWSMALGRRYALGHWCLTIDLDELLIYPMSEQMGLRDLTAWMEAAGTEGLLTLMVDMYPAPGTHYVAGQSFIEASPFFDRGPYWVTYSERFPHISFFGGMRHRMLFDGDSGEGPATRAGGPVLRKVPLVRWKPDTAYLASTHALMPCELSDMTGVLLHFKLLKDFHAYAAQEVSRGQRNPGEYESYLRLSPDEFWTKLHGSMTETYEDTAQMIALGLMAAPKTCLEEIFASARTDLDKDAATALWKKFKTARLAQARNFQPQIGHVLTDKAARRGDF